MVSTYSMGLAWLSIPPQASKNVQMLSRMFYSDSNDRIFMFYTHMIMICSNLKIHTSFEAGKDGVSCVQRSSRRARPRTLNPISPPINQAIAVTLPTSSMTLPLLRYSRHCISTNHFCLDLLRLKDLATILACRSLQELLRA